MVWVSNSDLRDSIQYLTARIIRLEKKLAYDFSNLDTAEADVIANMEKMIAKIAELSTHLAAVQVDDPAVQEKIDAVAAALRAEVAKVAA